MDILIIFCAKHLFLLSPFLAAFFLWGKDREYRLKVFKFALFSLPLTYLMGVLGRMLYYNPRPFFAENFEPLIPHLADNGFPSDHALLLAGIATLISAFDRKWSIPLWTIALIVGLARVLAGVHHALDILGSIGIALASGAIVYFVLYKQKAV